MCNTVFIKLGHRDVNKAVFKEVQPQEYFDKEWEKYNGKEPQDFPSSVLGCKS